MTAQALGQASHRRATAGRALSGWRPAVLAWPALWAALYALLCARNSFLFTTRLYENGDGAANSILAGQAAHFQLLVGNYSREGFHHPGPAFMYVQAFGTWLWHDLLGIVPTPYNGGWLAYLALNALMLTLVIRIVAAHSRSWLAAAGASAALVWWSVTHLQLASTWMPNLYEAPFVLFLVAAASVAAGRTADLPVYTLAGALLVHGHVAFILFVGVGTVILAVVLALRVRQGVRIARRSIVGSVSIAVLFAVPMVLEVVEHYPGPWGQYLNYASQHKNHHSLSAAWGFLTSYWGATGLGQLILGLAFLILCLVAWWVRRRLPLLLASALGLVIASLVLLYYATHGIDYLAYSYIGAFYLAVPLLVVTLWAWVTGDRLASVLAPSVRMSLTGASLLAAGLGIVFGPLDAGQASYGDPSLPTMVMAVNRAAPSTDGYALSFAPHEWPTVVGWLVEATRLRIRGCVVDASWRFMMTDEYICTRAEALSRRRLTFAAPGGRVTGQRVWSSPTVVIASSPAAGR